MTFFLIAPSSLNPRHVHAWAGAPPTTFPSSTTQLLCSLFSPHWLLPTGPLHGLSGTLLSFMFQLCRLHASFLESAVTVLLHSYSWDMHTFHCLLLLTRTAMGLSIIPEPDRDQGLVTLLTVCTRLNHVTLPYGTHSSQTSPIKRLFSSNAKQLPFLVGAAGGSCPKGMKRYRVRP